MAESDSSDSVSDVDSLTSDAESDSVSDVDSLTSDAECDSVSDIEPESYEANRTPIYNGSTVSRQEFSVALLSLFQKHNLTYDALSDTLKLFKHILPAPTTLPSTYHTLMKEFVCYDDHTVLHRCCACCTQLLSADDDGCSKEECRDFGEATFLEICLDKQLKERFMGECGDYLVFHLYLFCFPLNTHADAKFRELLNYRFTRHHHTDYLCDLFDGCVYRQHSDFFQNPFNVSFSLNYDGAPKFKSSNMQVWPIQLCLNELPPSARYVMM